MGYSVTSWFVDQCFAATASPVRVFNVSGFDLSELVLRWPKIKRTANEIKSTTVSVPLKNTEGDFNLVYNDVTTIQQSCYLQMGFTHPESGDELVTLFSGTLYNVQYKGREVTAIMRDKLWSFTQRKIGATSSGSTIVFSEQIPSDIFWTLATCYGGMSNTQDSSNLDIYWPDFEKWALQFSADSITNQAYYDGQKVAEAVEDLIQMNDSNVWTDCYGRIHVAKFAEPSSLDIVLTQEYVDALEIDINALDTINRQFINYNYSVVSNYWQNNLFYQNTASVNSFGLHEQVLQSQNVWFVDSADASGVGERIVKKYKTPPKTFTIDAGLMPLYREIGDTLRIVDSFWGITSASGWRITEIDIDMNGTIEMYVDETATAANAIYLDFSTYDSDDRLL